ncbi:hypothetical protein [Rhizohabitans arisaemae]|uniref:hypothetical protein n=1 Tax=Rhizohabitans arisaemae TaxID=2720610 RepID=UPI0024B158B3|nr:hypothetical protein [Rhizohabitans arisaemae]
MPDGFSVDGKIGNRWRSWGAADGPFGKATGPEEDVPGRNGRRQRFENGEIAWSPDQDMVVSGFRLRNDACFEWSKTGFGYDHHRCDITFNGASQGQSGLQLRPIDANQSMLQIWTRLQGFGEYGFTVRGVDDDDESPQGSTIPVRVQLGTIPGSPSPEWPPVTGVIAERWHELGAWEGPLGKPLEPEDVNPVGDIRNQEFEFGRIFTAPQFGPRMVIAVYQQRRSLVVSWGGGNIGFNAFRVDVTHNGTKFLERLVWVPTPDLEWARAGVSSGQFRLDNTRGNGLYTFRIHPTITLLQNPGLAPTGEPGVTVEPPAPFGNSLSPQDFSFGSTPEIAVWYDRGPADAILGPLPAGGTPADAYASNGARANDIARHYVHTRWLNLPSITATEDNTLQLIAYLQVLSVDRGFRTPGEPPALVLFHTALRTLNRANGHMGTSFDEFVSFLQIHLQRLGDYDMAVKGLMVILYRYRDLLTQEEVDHILTELVPVTLNGAHNPADESYPLATEVAPETENHMLMINSSRYLVNQLLFEKTGDAKVDNVGNGLAGWLLGYMHTIAKHDFLEFNARPYQRLSLHALMNLHDFAKDKTVRHGARILLDYIMVKFGVSSTRMRRVPPFRRLKETASSPGKINDLLREGIGGDPVTGFFAMYSGIPDRDGKPMRWFPDDWALNALIAGLSDYRPPPAAYILAMTRYPADLHLFWHGQRPQMHEADEDAMSGMEIYYHSPSFLLTAGGMWLNSGYGLDEWTGYKQVAIAQSTTLMFTRAFDVRVNPGDLDVRLDLDSKFADLIRFDRWPSLRIVDAEDNETESLDRDAVNTGVHRGFACGAEMQVPDKWLLLAGASWDGPWLFLDLGKQPEPTVPEPLRFYGSLGVYVAIYRTPVDPQQAEFLNVLYDAVPPKTLGFLYVIEADTPDPSTGAPITFTTFQELVRQRNTFPNPLRWSDFYSFHTVDNHRFDFWVRPDSHTYAPRVELDDQPLFPENAPLANSPYLKTPGGHDGKFEVTHPSCDAPLILDFRDRNDPRYLDNIAACPQPWLDRAAALAVFTQTLANAGRRREATAAMIERVLVYRRLTEADPEKYRPLLATALFELIFYHRAGLDAGSTQKYARQGLHTYEELAGLRTPGSETPVDYEQLSTFTPNQHWGWPLLAGALWNLTWTNREAGDFTAAAGWTVKRIRVYRRAAQVDPDTYRPLAADALWELIFYHRAGLDAASIQSYARQGLIAYEELADLRSSGSQDPVDYEQLDDFTPNQYWEWHMLTGALWNLAWTNREAGNHTAAADWTVKRIRVHQRLAQIDPEKHRPTVADALWELIFYHRAGLDPAAIQTYAQQGLAAYEELAGLRPPGSQAPVDYDQLATFTPNHYWEWHMLTGALWNLAWTNREAGNHTAAADWTIKRIRVYERLAQTDPGTHRPTVADALWELIFYHRAGLDAASVQTYARQGLARYEELAGLHGSPNPVDYDQLAAFTPNQFWEWHMLTGALWNLAWTNHEAGNHTAAADWTIKRIRVYERLAQTDPVKHRPSLADAVFELIFYHRAGLDPAAVHTYAQQGLTVYEELAGLRQPGVTGPVDYDQLASVVPNQHWPSLAGALWNLAWVKREAGDRTAGAAWMARRVRVFERLVQIDPDKWQASLTQAEAEAASFST